MDGRQVRRCIRERVGIRQVDGDLTVRSACGPTRSPNHDSRPQAAGLHRVGSRSLSGLGHTASRVWMVLLQGVVRLCSREHRRPPTGAYAGQHWEVRLWQLDGDLTVRAARGPTSGRVPPRPPMVHWVKWIGGPRVRFGLGSSQFDSSQTQLSVTRRPRKAGAQRPRRIRVRFDSTTGVPGDGPLSGDTRVVTLTANSYGSALRFI